MKTKTADKPAPAPFTLAELEAEFAEIAAKHGIVFDNPSEQTGFGERGERTRYKKPGERCGRGYVRHISEKQLRFIIRLFRERDTSSLVRLPGSENVEHMSLKGATDLIDRLLCCPMKPVELIEPTMASEAQIAYIRSLMAQRDVTKEKITIAEETINRGVTIEWASKAINKLLAYPIRERQLKPANATATERCTGGWVGSDGTIYHVQKSRNNSKLYCKVFNTEADCYVYEPGAYSKLCRDQEAHRMTYNEAVEFANTTSHCGNCGRKLTAKESVERSIGPICAGKLGI